MTQPRSDPLHGIFWMLVTGVCFVAVTALVKFLGPRVPPQEAAFLRYLLGLIFLVPMLGTLTRLRITPRQWRYFTLRGVCHSGAVLLWFFAMTRIPLTEVTAMNYLAPVCVSIGAALFLGEKFAIRRFAAVIVALLGTIIILRPGIREISPGHWAMLFAAIGFAGSYLWAKVLADELPASIIVAMLSIIVTIVLAPFAISVWVTPGWFDLAILFTVAAFATAGHYTMTLAFAAAPVTVTQPVTFLQLLWATLLQVIVFSEAVDVYVILGGLIILGAVTFISWRESRLNRRPITPPHPATKS